MALRFFAKVAFIGVGAGVVMVDSCTDSLGLLTCARENGKLRVDFDQKQKQESTAVEEATRTSPN